ncbi:ribonuclease HII [Methylomarinovum caldicuralii]|uniref:Ribonuclease HII n=1 Tax=Methylomarinovum caldicuralii TaxID=438856 RepID=A0AAU9BUJ6_9GAMM|nr:ribonuclease HII [Methylomarinovum caldicuralii]BCX82638.1 ribonuclease HII [Methylomarinovum caldicuralii]
MDYRAGVDEVGRGCLAGAVFAAAVILDPARPIEGLTDSKKLTAGRRQTLAREIEARALARCVARAEPSEIDRHNILQASLLAMRRAVAGLALQPAAVRVDGRHAPDLPMPVETVIGGDASVPEIAAASILAKVARDREMQLLDRLAPGYGIAAHKGYPTAAHRQALRRLGPSPWHRRSFRPVKEALRD